MNQDHGFNFVTSFSYPVVEVGPIEVSEKRLRRFDANFALLVGAVYGLTRLAIDDLNLNKFDDVIYEGPKFPIF